MSMGSTLYNNVLKRSATYVPFVLLGAIVLDSMYSGVVDGMWNTVNSGVRVWAAVSVLLFLPRRVFLLLTSRRVWGVVMCCCVLLTWGSAQKTFDSVDWSKFDDDDEDDE